MNKFAVSLCLLSLITLSLPGRELERFVKLSYPLHTQTDSKGWYGVPLEALTNNEKRVAIMFGSSGKQEGGLSVSTGYLGDFSNTHEFRFEALLAYPWRYGLTPYFGGFLGYGDEKGSARRIVVDTNSIYGSFYSDISGDKRYYSGGLIVGTQYQLTDRWSLDFACHYGGKQYESFEYATDISGYAYTMYAGQRHDDMELNALRFGLVYRFR